MSYTRDLTVSVHHPDTQELLAEGLPAEAGQKHVVKYVDEPLGVDTEAGRNDGQDYGHH